MSRQGQASAHPSRLPVEGTSLSCSLRQGWEEASLLPGNPTLEKAVLSPLGEEGPSDITAGPRTRLAAALGQASKWDGGVALGTGTWATSKEQ